MCYNIKKGDFVKIIKAECNSVDAMHILKGSIWLLITVSCWFYTLFLFDTLGDAVGFEGAYWVIIVLVAFRSFGFLQMGNILRDNMVLLIRGWV